jgi:hypothetical protein
MTPPSPAALEGLEALARPQRRSSANMLGRHDFGLHQATEVAGAIRSSPDISPAANT